MARERERERESEKEREVGWDEAIIPEFLLRERERERERERGKLNRELWITGWTN